LRFAKAMNASMSTVSVRRKSCRRVASFEYHRRDIVATLDSMSPGGMRPEAEAIRRSVALWADLDKFNESEWRAARVSELGRRRLHVNAPRRKVRINLRVRGRTGRGVECAAGSCSFPRIFIHYRTYMTAHQPTPT